MDEPLGTLAIDSDQIALLHKRLNFAERAAFATAFAERVNAEAAARGRASYDALVAPSGVEAIRLSEALAADGHVALGSRLDAAQLAEIGGYFAALPCFNAHVYSQSDRRECTTDALAASSRFGCYRPEDVVMAPHLLELANDPTILAAVARYLGCVPTLYSMNAWWSFPWSTEDVGLTQGFHRDQDDFKNCVLFVYLTDVSDGDGAHEYISGSHRPETVRRMLGGPGPYVVDIGSVERSERVAVTLENMFDTTAYGGDAVFAKLFPAGAEAIEGPQGTAFLSDPRGLHRARAPRTRRRLIAWLRYGMHRNKAYVLDELAPIAREKVGSRLPDQPASRFINRLVVSPE